MTEIAETETVDLGNPQHVQKREQKLKAKERDQAADIRAMLEVPGARRTLRRLLETARPHCQSYAPGDPHQTAFNEGARVVGIWLDVELQRAGSSAAAILKEPE